MKFCFAWFEMTVLGLLMVYGNTSNPKIKRCPKNKKRLIYFSEIEIRTLIL